MTRQESHEPVLERKQQLWIQVRSPRSVLFGFWGYDKIIAASAISGNKFLRVIVAFGRGILHSLDLKTDHFFIHLSRSFRWCVRWCPQTGIGRTSDEAHSYSRHNCCSDGHCTVPEVGNAVETSYALTTRKKKRRKWKMHVTTSWGMCKLLTHERHKFSEYQPVWHVRVFYESPRVFAQRLVRNCVWLTISYWSEAWVHVWWVHLGTNEQPDSNGNTQKSAHVGTLQDKGREEVNYSFVCETNEESLHWRGGSTICRCRRREANNWW